MSDQVRTGLCKHTPDEPRACTFCGQHHEFFCGEYRPSPDLAGVCLPILWTADYPAPEGKIWGEMVPPDHGQQVLIPVPGEGYRLAIVQVVTREVTAWEYPEETAGVAADLAAAAAERITTTDRGKETTWTVEGGHIVRRTTAMGHDIEHRLTTGDGRPFASADRLELSADGRITAWDVRGRQWVVDREANTVKFLINPLAAYVAYDRPVGETGLGELGHGATQVLIDRIATETSRSRGEVERALTRMAHQTGAGVGRCARLAAANPDNLHGYWDGDPDDPDAQPASASPAASAASEGAMASETAEAEAEDGEEARERRRIHRPLAVGKRVRGAR